MPEFVTNLDVWFDVENQEDAEDFVKNVLGSVILIPEEVTALEASQPEEV